MNFMRKHYVEFSQYHMQWIWWQNFCAES